MNINIGVGNKRFERSQAELVLHQLKEKGEIVVFDSSDDISVPRELYESILENKIDAAVFDMKHLPLERPAGIEIAAVLKRNPPFDFLVVDKELEDVYNIGTTSLRRRAQLLRYYHKYPEMHVSPITGDIDDRLEKLQRGEYDAIVVDEATLKCLGYMVHGFRLPADAFVPSPNQGAVAIVSDVKNKEFFSSFNDMETAFDTSVERAILEKLAGESIAPVGVYAQGGRVLAEVLSPDGSKAVRVESEVPCIEAACAIGKALKEKSDSFSL